MFNMYVPQMIEMEMLLPVLIPILAIGLILVASLTMDREGMKLLFVIIIGFCLTSAVLWARRWLVAPDLMVMPPVILNGSILFDRLSLFMSIFLCLSLGGVLMVSVTLWSRTAWEWPVFLCVILGSLVGMILLASSRHLIFFAIAVELASMPSYILVAFRRFSSKSAEGAAKYVIFGAVCSAIMIYGISILYGLTGSFDFQEIALRISGNGIQLIELVALICLLTGIAFKISLVPVHFWCPDVFEAAGADVAAWLSVGSKSAALIALARFVQTLGWFADDVFNNRMVLFFTVIAIVTMTVANLAAYWQTSVKRLLAYSSIAHAGYMVAGILILSDISGVAAVVAYIIVYLLMNLGAFTVTGLIEKQTGGDDLKNFAGLSTRNPFLAAMMMFFLFSLVGLPPLAGFAVKWILIAALWQKGITILVLAILINTLLSLFYYMKVARAIYFERSELPVMSTPALSGVVVAVCAAGLIALFIGWGSLAVFSRSMLLAVFG